MSDPIHTKTSKFLMRSELFTEVSIKNTDGSMCSGRNLSSGMVLCALVEAYLLVWFYSASNRNEYQKHKNNNVSGE
jgi:hypothetical protein